LLARLMTTLDHLSRGRIAWNVVTSYKVEEALNFGYKELLDHDQRYDRADEYMELCYRLWSSWDPDAVVMDPRTDTFADPAKVPATGAGEWGARPADSARGEDVHGPSAFRHPAGDNRGDGTEGHGRLRFLGSWSPRKLAAAGSAPFISGRRSDRARPRVAIADRLSCHRLA